MSTTRTEIQALAMFFRNDKPGGIGIKLIGPTVAAFVSETHRKAEASWNAAADKPAYARQLIRELETIGAMSQREKNDAREVILGHLHVLTRAKAIPDDEFNGVVYFRDPSDQSGMTKDQTLQFLTLDTGHSEAIPLSFVPADILRDLRDIVAKGYGRMCRFEMLVTMAPGSAAFTTFVDKHPIANGTVCWEARDSDAAFSHAMESWSNVLALTGFGRNARQTRRPSIVPWSTVNLIPFGLVKLFESKELAPEDISTAGSLHSCLSWAIVTEANSRQTILDGGQATRPISECISDRSRPSTPGSHGVGKSALHNQSREAKS